jgi:hypothetical protein
VEGVRGDDGLEGEKVEEGSGGMSMRPLVSKAGGGGEEEGELGVWRKEDE